MLCALCGGAFLARNALDKESILTSAQYLYMKFSITYPWASWFILLIEGLLEGSSKNRQGGKTQLTPSIELAVKIELDARTFIGHYGWDAATHS
jgi:hypothetical protein